MNRNDCFSKPGMGIHLVVSGNQHLISGIHSEGFFNFVSRQVPLTALLKNIHNH